MWRDFIKNPFKSAVPYIIFHFSNHQIFFAVSQSHVCIVYINIFNEIFYWYTPYNDKFYKLWIITKWTNLCVQKTCEMRTTESALRGEEVKFRDQKMVKEFATNHITRVPGFISVQFSHSVLSNSLWPEGPQHTRLPVHHQLPEFTQTHVHWVGDAIQPSHPLSFPSPTFNLSQHQGLLKLPGSVHEAQTC